MHVKVSKDGGQTWINDFDLGASHGIRNAVHVEAVGGSSGRAAVGFFGTDIPGPYQDDTFTGVWYAFISTTYDGGKTWVTVNASPNDPVQRKTGVWQQGGGEPTAICSTSTKLPSTTKDGRSMATAMVA